MLMPVIVPAPGSAGWLPAGLESDRRIFDRHGSAYGGPERRRPCHPRAAVTVYRASG
jgi:hypothetical protein